MPQTQTERRQAGDVARLLDRSPKPSRMGAMLVALAAMAVIAFVVAPWPIYWLIERGLAPGTLLAPYSSLCLWTAGTFVGDALVWWIDCAADGHF